MPTKIIDLDFENIPNTITNLDGYDRAMVLVRIQGKPVERIFLPILDGRISKQELRQHVFKNAGKVFWQYWLGLIFSYPMLNDINCAPPAATIAICSRDRPDDLKRCLEALTQIFDKDQEILVVDSCSKNADTEQVVDCFPGVVYVRETLPGLNRARNRALLETRNEIVAFIDDDAIPDQNWLSSLTKNFYHPNVACVTGLTMPIELETPAQELFEQISTFSRGFEHKEFAWNYTNPIGAGQIGAGTNMALRKSLLFDRVGLFDETLDAGTPTYSGGDTEMFSRILMAGYRIIYEPQALNWHRHRRTLKELRKTIYGYGVGSYAFWTKTSLVEGEWYAAWIALHWFFAGQIPRLLRSLFDKKNSLHKDLFFREMLGSLAGPWLYLKSRRQNFKKSKS